MGGVQSKRSPDTKAPTLILDATPLIYICKSQLAQHLKVLKAHYNLCTTREVYHEVYIKGLQKRVAEIETLKELFEGGLVEVLTEAQQKETNSVKLEEFQLLKTSGLHTGEITIMQAASSLGATAIVDDKRARNIGRVIGINISGTANLIVEFVKLKAISKIEAKDGINKMIKEGWYCSTKDYVQIMNAIEFS